MKSEKTKSLLIGISDGALYAAEWTASFLLLTMVVVALYQVFGRYVLNDSPSWSEEFAILCMIWFGFLGISIGVRKKLHIAIEYFAGLLPKRWQTAVEIFAGVMVIAFAGALFVFGLVKTVESSHRLPGTGFPGMVQYVVVPVAAVAIMIHTLRDLIAGDEE